jgi:hypothetical protein
VNFSRFLIRATAVLSSTRDKIIRYDFYFTYNLNVYTHTFTIFRLYNTYFLTLQNKSFCDRDILLSLSPLISSKTRTGEGGVPEKCARLVSSRNRCGCFLAAWKGAILLTGVSRSHPGFGMGDDAHFFPRW